MTSMAATSSAISLALRLWLSRRQAGASGGSPPCRPPLLPLRTGFSEDDKGGLPVFFFPSSSSVGIGHYRCLGQRRGRRGRGLMLVFVGKDGQVLGGEAKDGEAGAHHGGGDGDLGPLRQV